MAPKIKLKEGKGRKPSEAARFDWKRYGKPSQIVEKMARLVLQYEAQIKAELAMLAEDNKEAKQTILKAGLALGYPFYISFSEEIMELEVPQFKYLDFDKQKAAKFLLAQLEDIGRGRLDNMMKERADWESLDLRNPWNHIKPVESREDTHDPWSGYVPGMGNEERDEGEEDRELEELEALASAAGGPFPTIWEEVPAFHGFSNKNDAQYTAQMVSVEPTRRGAPGEKYWHFHNGSTTRGRSGKNEDEDRARCWR
jgi:hypothetical protein